MSAPAFSIPVPSETPTRADTNRRNAQSSTGPRTPEGKQRVRLNALRHGLYSAEVVLPGEDLEAYRALGLMLYAHYRPTTGIQRRLVQTIHDLDWQITRVSNLESSYYTLNTQRELAKAEAGEGDPGLRRGLADTTIAGNPNAARGLAGAVGWETHAREFDQLGRHQVRLSRLREKAIIELTTERQAYNRWQYQQKLIAEQAAKKAPTPIQSATPEDDGFDPQPAIRRMRERLQTLAVQPAAGFQIRFIHPEDGFTAPGGVPESF